MMIAIYSNYIYIFSCLLSVLILFVYIVILMCGKFMHQNGLEYCQLQQNHIQIWFASRWNWSKYLSIRQWSPQSTISQNPRSIYSTILFWKNADEYRIWIMLMHRMYINMCCDSIGDERNKIIEYIFQNEMLLSDQRSFFLFYSPEYSYSAPNACRVYRNTNQCITCLAPVQICCPHILESCKTHWILAYVFVFVFFAGWNVILRNDFPKRENCTKFAKKFNLQINNFWFIFFCCE